MTHGFLPHRTHQNVQERKWWDGVLNLAAGPLWTSIFEFDYYQIDGHSSPAFQNDLRPHLLVADEAGLAVDTSPVHERRRLTVSRVNQPARRPLPRTTKLLILLAPLLLVLLAVVVAVVVDRLTNNSALAMIVFATLSAVRLSRDHD